MMRIRLKMLTGRSTHAMPSGGSVALGCERTLSGFRDGFAGIESPPPTGSK